MPNELVTQDGKNSAFAEFSMVVTKTRFDPNEVNPNRRMQWRSVNSDIDEDLYEESMSTELFYDFVYRIRENIPVPDEFEDAICEGDWCGGMPYLSIAHYKAGTGLTNVPGIIDSVYVEGAKLKSRGYCNDSEMGRRVYEALRNDLIQRKSGNAEHKPVRISIGFLDLQHKHLPKAGGQEFIFTRSGIGQICPLCAQGIGGKIYMKGQLIHLALTRVPVNPRTEMVAEGMEEKSMSEITTKKQDAESIIGDLANELEEKSIASDILVVRSDENGSAPVASQSDLQKCYDPNTGGWNPDCLSSIMDKYMPEIRRDIGVPIKSEALPKEALDAMVAHIYKSNGYELPVVEEAMEPTVEKTVVDSATPETPAPIKAEVVVEEKVEEPKELSKVDKAYSILQEAMKSGNVEEVNKAFGILGTSVEEEFKPEVKPVDANDIAAIVRSAVQEVVAPLQLKIATLESALNQKSATVANGVVQSKALSLNPGGLKVEDIVQRSGQPVAPQAPARKLTQIEMIARKSTGADR